MSHNLTNSASTSLKNNDELCNYKARKYHYKIQYDLKKKMNENPNYIVPQEYEEYLGDYVPN